MRPSIAYERLLRAKVLAQSAHPLASSVQRQVASEHTVERVSGSRLDSAVVALLLDLVLLPDVKLAAVDSREVLG